MEASTEVRRQVLEYVQGNPYTTETELLQEFGQQGIGAVSALWELADEGCFSSSGTGREFTSHLPEHEYCADSSIVLPEDRED